jgi:hypothetical protein
MALQDRVSCISVMTTLVLACLFVSNSRWSQRVYTQANRKPRSRSGSETTKHTRVSDQRGVDEPHALIARNRCRKEGPCDFSIC